MTIALSKISCLSDRLIPLGLACLQAYLKYHSIPVKVFNFRTDQYSLPKVASDPLIQLTPPRFIMNHQDFPILIPIVDSIMSNSELDLNDGIFPDIINDYASRLFETPNTTQTRFESMISYVHSIIPKFANKFNIIGFSINYLNIPETVIASSLIKQLYPDIQIIWGGPTMTQSQEAFKIFLLKNICDGLVIGEGEFPLLEIAQETDLHNVKGLMSVSANKVFNHSKGIQLNIDSLPTPDYTDIPLNSYFQIASTYRSRGCTHRCKFCAEWNLFGPRFRVRSVENIINDIETIIDNYHPKYMILGESLVNDDLKYFHELCNKMIEKEFEINFGTHFRANVTQELANKAALAHFDDAWIGFEAFSDQNLKKMNKGTSVNQNFAAIKNLTQAGINVIAMLVVGFNDLEEEMNNCNHVLEAIEHFTHERVKDDNGENHPVSIQWRPAPMYILPGSLDYQEKKFKHLLSWKPKFITPRIKPSIQLLEQELKDIPYEFERPIPDEIVGKVMKMIQQADRKAGFAIGGLTKHIINFMVEERKSQRFYKKYERIGVAAQRYNKNYLRT
ncbi:MAG: B12-binding domain-containing radical SAM protein [Promethearchaeota archaeon]|jgi:radical SAM superfamily enzyme YgiQ (UPF0313 family)